MNSYKEYLLGSAALEYVIEVLGDGLSLSRMILARTDLEGGCVTARFPDVIDQSRLDRFESGGLLPIDPGSMKIGVTPRGTLHPMSPIPNTDADTGRLICDFLGGGDDRVCVFENRLSRRDHRWLASATSRVCFFGDEVYHVLRSHAAGPELVEATIREARTLPATLGVLSTLSGPAFLPGEDVVSERSLHEIADKATSILVGAYDGEGFLIWREGPPSGTGVAQSPDPASNE